LAAQGDQLVLGHGDDALLSARRVGVNVNKYWTSVRNTQMARLAMEVFGGNGAIESFSIIPQLYRDAMVLESWEGTHNTLVQQVIRDAQRLRLHRPFLENLEDSLARLDLAEAHNSARTLVAQGIQALVEPLNRLADGEGDQRWGRRIVDQMAVTQALVALLEELASAPDDEACRSAIEFIAKRDLKMNLEPPAKIPRGLL